MFNIESSRLEDPVRPLGAPIRPEPPKPEPPAEKWVPTGTPGYSRSTTTDKVRNDSYKLVDDPFPIVIPSRPTQHIIRDFSRSIDEMIRDNYVADGDPCGIKFYGVDYGVSASLAAVDRLFGEQPISNIADTPTQYVDDDTAVFRAYARAARRMRFANASMPHRLAVLAAFRDGHFRIPAANAAACIAALDTLEAS